MKLSRLFRVVLIAAILTAMPLFAETSGTRLITTRIIHHGIVLDGWLKEADWQSAQKISHFVQRELKEGEPATEKTRVAVLYSKDALYIGVMCYDSEPRKIVAREMRRDFSYGKDDNFKIFLDTYDDNRSGYLFVINPNGAKADALILENGRRVNSNWDGIWYVHTRRSSLGWSAEIKIPFSTLHFQGGRHQVWGINFERNIKRKKEELRWRGWSRNARFTDAARSGKLTGLDNLRWDKKLEINPYSLGGFEKSYRLQGVSRHNFGLDGHFLATPTVKVDFSINPDFAQAESDPLKINLSRFSLLYPEKREFFLEGLNYFNFSLGSRIRPFYSRRVGLAKDRTEVPIYYGGRVLGRIGSSTFGAMVMQTADKTGGPQTNISVFRWKKNIWKQSSFGFIATNRLMSGNFNGVYGFDFLYSSSGFFGNRDFRLSAASAVSHSGNRSHKLGSAQRVSLSLPGDVWAFQSSWERSGKNFRPEVGFLKRTHYQRYFLQVNLKSRPGFLPGVRSVSLKPLSVTYYMDDVTHHLTSLYAEIQPLSLKFFSGERVEFTVQNRTESIEKNFEIYDGVTIPVARYRFTRYQVSFQSFQGRAVSTGGGYSWGRFYDGQRRKWNAKVSWRINKHFSIYSRFQRNSVHLPFGSFQIREFSSRFRFAVSPRLFGAIWAQWNDISREVLLNFRVNWRSQSGNNLYLVINQTFDAAGRGFRQNRSVVLSKLVWRFAL